MWENKGWVYWVNSAHAQQSGSGLIVRGEKFGDHVTKAIKNIVSNIVHRSFEKPKCQFKV